MPFLLYQVHLNNIYKNEGLLRSSKSSIYQPAGNWQAEKTVGTVWKAVQLTLSTSNLPLSHYESVLCSAFHQVIVMCRY